MRGRKSDSKQHGGESMSRKIHARSSFEWLPLTLGSVISVAIGTFFYVRTDLNAALAVFAGLLGTGVALQLEMLMQTRQRERRYEERVELLGHLETLPWLMSATQQQIAAIESINETAPGGVPSSLARKSVEACVAELRDLDRGHYYTQFMDNWLLYSMTEGAQTEILATSADNPEWWGRPSGKTYWHLQVAAMKERDVRMERIFIYQTWTPILESALIAQREAGVLTRRILLSDVPPHLRRDMIIWDRNAGYEANTISVTDRIRNKFTFARDEVDGMVKDFDAIRSISEPWPSSPTAASSAS